MNKANKLHILLFLWWSVRSVVDCIQIGRCVTQAKGPVSTSPVSLCAVNKNDGVVGGNSDDNTKNKFDSTTTTTTVDVSDLGVTIDELNAPLPQDFLQGVVTTGYESTSRIPSVQDNGCKWTESTSNTSIGGISNNNDDEGEGSGTMDVTLTIPGLRGQPAAALNVQFATNTITVTAFGYIVWSAILRGEVIPESAAFTTRDGDDMVPVIDILVQKKKRNLDDERWGGFILQIGENSLL